MECSKVAWKHHEIVSFYTFCTLLSTFVRFLIDFGRLHYTFCLHICHTVDQVCQECQWTDWYTSGFSLGALCRFDYTLLHYTSLHSYTWPHSICYTLLHFVYIHILHSTSLQLLHFTTPLSTPLSTLLCYTLSTLLSYTWLDYICYTRLHFWLHSDPTLCYTTLATLCLHSDPTLCYTILATLCLHSYPTLCYTLSTLGPYTFLHSDPTLD